MGVFLLAFHGLDAALGRAVEPHVEEFLESEERGRDGKSEANRRSDLEARISKGSSGISDRLRGRRELGEGLGCDRGAVEAAASG